MCTEQTTHLHMLVYARFWKHVCCMIGGCHINGLICTILTYHKQLGGVAQSVGHLTYKSEVLGSIPGPATYFYFSFHWFKKGSCQLLVKVSALSTG